MPRASTRRPPRKARMRSWPPPLTPLTSPPRARPLPVLFLRSGPAPAEQCDPDELEHHDGLVLGAFSDDDDSGPEGAASAAAPARAKVCATRCSNARQRLLPPARRAVWVPTQMHPCG